MKRTFLLFLIILFYMAKVAYSQEIKPGVVITKDNLKKYLPELKEILPLGPLEHFKDGVKEGQITIPIVKKRIYSPPPGYARATAKNEGGLRVAKDNTLTGHWHGGLPFPRPETGQELAWNVYRRRECMEEFQLKVNYLLFDKNHQLERSFKNYFFKKCYVGRTDILPSPEISGNNGLLNWKEVFLVVEPLDVKGFSMIRIHYEDLYRDDDVYSYIPAIRRIRRLTGSDVTDPVLGSDGCYDDFEGWHQKLNPKMTFKILGKREFLVPRHSLKKQLPKESEYIKKDFFQIEWEVRPLFILEVQLNDPDYAYSKRIYFTEDDGTAGIAYGEAYDQKGRFWRCNYIYIHRYIEPETLHRNYYGCMFKDVISGHSSAMPTDPVDLNLSKVFIPEEYFTVRGLLRKAR